MAEERLQRREPDASQKKVDEARKEMIDSWDAMEHLWHRMMRLRNRVTLVNRHAPHWTWLSSVTVSFDQVMRALNPHPTTFRLPPEMEIQDASTKRLAELYDGVGEAIHRATDTMRPPPTYPWRRWRITVIWHARRLTGTLKPAPLPFAAAADELWQQADRRRLDGEEPDSTG